MMYITGHDRSQLLLLPEAVDDYVGSDNPVRFIDAFVDGLDLAAASFSRVEPKVLHESPMGLIRQSKYLFRLKEAADRVESERD